MNDIFAHMLLKLFNAIILNLTPTGKWFRQTLNNLFFITKKKKKKKIRIKDWVRVSPRANYS